MVEPCFNTKFYIKGSSENLAELLDVLADISRKLREEFKCKCVGRHMFACACSDGLLIKTSLANSGSVGRLPMPTLSQHSAVAVSVSSDNALALVRMLEVMTKEVRDRGFSLFGFY